jgi:hypothetical protein
MAEAKQADPMVTTVSSPFANGRDWVRADFHLHTQADKEFSYTGEENSFAAAYVAALKKADIRLGVISNHNKFNAGQQTNGLLLGPLAERLEFIDARRGRRLDCRSGSRRWS